MSYFDGKNILITGGTGTVGTVLVETILAISTPSRLIVFSRDEHKQFFMAKKFPQSTYPCMRYFIGDIRNKQRLIMAFENVDLVFHTAAMKHVGIVEYNPFEAVLTNIIGSQNIVEACLAQRVSKAIIIGTDKAVSPANFYGATKLCGDKLFIVGNNIVGQRDTRFCVVRCGNLFGSRGSVIPIFAKLLAEGRTQLPVTDIRMTRTTMLPAATAAFLLKCIEMMNGAEVFVPKLPSYRVVDVAKALNPGGKVKVIGAGAGEKLHEVMISPEEALRSIEYEDYYAIYSEEEHRRLTAANPNLIQGKYYTSSNNDVFLSIEEIRKLTRALHPEVAKFFQMESNEKDSFSFSNLQRCFIIAEAGCNHNGDLALAKKLVDVAKDAGADAVKFQTFVVKNLCTEDAKQAEYQSKNTEIQESQSDMLKKLELPLSAYRELQQYCKEKNIIFFSTPFDSHSLETLQELNVPIIKIGSGDVTNIPFLSEIGKTGIPTILSTGMSTLDDVRLAYNTLTSSGCPDIAILHCTSNYPAAPNEVNLLAMKTLKETFGVPVGYSDHTIGSTVAAYAVAMGGKILEKHFTFDKNAPGPDHLMSASPEELTEYVKTIRDAEILLGDGIKVPQKSEIETKKVVTKYVVAKYNIPKNTKLTMEMLSCKRGGYGGFIPKDISKAIGQVVCKDVSMDEAIHEGLFI
jgi:N-acetylneuraminate synthase/N,N'-diacetyllegionaminate synthase